MGDMWITIGFAVGCTLVLGIFLGTLMYKMDKANRLSHEKSQAMLDRMERDAKIARERYIKTERRDWIEGRRYLRRMEKDHEDRMAIMRMMFERLE